LRSKESTVDYRFFPEPDLHDVMITDEDIERVRTEIPILPDARRVVYTESLGLSDYDAAILSSDIGLSNYFDMAQGHTKYKKQLANLLISEVMRLVEGEDFFCPISAERLAELCELVGEEEINSSTAKKLLARMWNDDKLMPKETVEREDLSQINDESEILKLAKAAIEKNPKAVEDYRNGKSFAIRSIIGKAMAASAGRANPRILEEMILREIK
jgi:aspartyl-tRNA(Asn)/glutamyl-tRNA(Gln) amidotransferase subunit B